MFIYFAVNSSLLMETGLMRAARLNHAKSNQLIKLVLHLTAKEEDISRAKRRVNIGPKLERWSET